MNALLAALREELGAFVEGRVSLPDLNRWLVERTEPLAAAADAGDSEINRLADEAWFVVAEWEAERMSDDAVRRRLLEALVVPATVVATPFSDAATEAAPAISFATSVPWNEAWRPVVVPPDAEATASGPARAA